MDVLPNLKKKDIMHILQIGSDRATRMLENGEIPAFKIGKVWHIPVAEFTKWLENNCKQQARVQGYIYANQINFIEVMTRYHQFLKEKGYLE